MESIHFRNAEQLIERARKYAEEREGVRDEAYVLVLALAAQTEATLALVEATKRVASATASAAG
jgi:hypothetical protein